jgi:hypothetical protein
MIESYDVAGNMHLGQHYVFEHPDRICAVLGPAGDVEMAHAATTMRCNWQMLSVAIRPGCVLSSSHGAPLVECTTAQLARRRSRAHPDTTSCRASGRPPLVSAGSIARLWQGSTPAISRLRARSESQSRQMWQAVGLRWHVCFADRSNIAF